MVTTRDQRTSNVDSELVREAIAWVLHYVKEDEADVYVQPLLAMTSLSLYLELRTIAVMEAYLHLHGLGAVDECYRLKPRVVDRLFGVVEPPRTMMSEVRCLARRYDPSVLTARLRGQADIGQNVTTLCLYRSYGLPGSQAHQGEGGCGGPPGEGGPGAGEQPGEPGRRAREWPRAYASSESSMTPVEVPVPVQRRPWYKRLGLWVVRALDPLSCCTAEVDNALMDELIRSRIRVAYGEHDVNECRSQDGATSDDGGSIATVARMCLEEERYSLVSDGKSNGQRKVTAVVPKFAATVALHLRTRLGKLVDEPANRLLVEREYLRVCRLRKVRDIDIVAHQAHVMNAFFYEDVLDRIAATRHRMPKWVAWLVGVERGSSGPNTPC